MKYKIYQIKNLEQCDYGFMPWRFAHDKFNMNDYQKVYEGSIEQEDTTQEVSTTNYLEHLFYVFNCEHPKDFKGRSLSVSDVVELEGVGSFYCDSSGWQKLEA